MFEKMKLILASLTLVMAAIAIPVLVTANMAMAAQPEPKPLPEMEVVDLGLTSNPQLLRFVEVDFGIDEVTEHLEDGIRLSVQLNGQATLIPIMSARIDRNLGAVQIHFPDGMFRNYGFSDVIRIMACQSTPFDELEESEWVDIRADLFEKNLKR